MTTTITMATGTTMATIATSTESMPAIAVELKAPDIGVHRKSSTGTEYVHTFESGKPGPHVLVNALTHGNEICGAIVVDRLLREGLRPARGTLTLAFANVEAFARFDPKNPYATRFVDEDFNRVWTPEVLGGKRESVELARARELRPFIEAADYLLDIHSMLEPSPPVMICGPLEKGIRFAFDVGIPEHVVSDTGHANGTRMRDYGGFGDPASPKNALLVECGQHWERNAERVAWQTHLAVPAASRRGRSRAGRAPDRGARPAAAAGARDRSGGRELAGIPLRQAVLGNGSGAAPGRRHRMGRRPGGARALRQLRAGDAGAEQREDRADRGAAGPPGDALAAGDVLALAGRAYAELLQLAVEVRALEADAVGHSRHVAFLAPDVVQEVLLLELLARVAQRQVKRHAHLGGRLLARPRG